MSEAVAVLARVWRSGRIESVHRGRAVAATPDGRIVARIGDARGGIFVRSAAKPFQALPLLEAGGERAFRLTSAELALMCSSHGGEPAHVRTAARLLAKGGFSERDLLCGAHAPMHAPSAARLLRRGEAPRALHNNCSGKHAGLLLACRLYGFSPRGYIETSHPIHREILARLSAFTGVAADGIPVGVDGCSLPVFWLPLSALARGYARLASDQAGASASRLVAAMGQRPDMMAGRQRFTTDFLRVGGGRWVGKEGAEGVYAIGLRAPQPLGLAFKIEDGGIRARDAVSLALLEDLGRLPRAAARALAAHRAPAVINARGRLVGQIEAVARFGGAKMLRLRAKAR